jgi:hypothetical protein
MRTPIEEFAADHAVAGPPGDTTAGSSDELVSSEQALPGSQADVPIPPLAVSGIVVTKAALVAALQIYMPQLVDLAPVEGGRYYLSAEPITTLQTNGETDD